MSRCGLYIAISRKSHFRSYFLPFPFPLYSVITYPSSLPSLSRTAPLSISTRGEFSHGRPDI